jgi:hypothetical protein
MAAPSKPSPSATEKIKFSFEYYDLDSKPDYCLSSCVGAGVKMALSRLKDINTKSFNELMSQRRVYHFGEVDWSQTIEKKGFPDPRVNQMSAFHFSLLSVDGQLTRVFGGYYNATFYIVWFDIKHQIWPSLLKHT